MNSFSLEIEFRRIIKTLIRYISDKILWSLIKTKNLEIIPKNFSWVILDELGLNLRYKGRIDFRRPLGSISWNKHYNRCFQIFKNIKSKKEVEKYFFYPFFSSFSSFCSSFTSIDTKFIDSYFQVKRRFTKHLPLLFSNENFFGFLISLWEILEILFLKITQKSKFHRISFLRVKNLIFKVNKQFKNNFPTIKIKTIFINLLSRKKIL